MNHLPLPAKKSLRYPGLLLVMLLTVTTLTSCEPDDDNFFYYDIAGRWMEVAPYYGDIYLTAMAPATAITKTEITPTLNGKPTTII